MLSSVERLFFDGDVRRAAEMIDSHLWTDAEAWSRAGLIREFCDNTPAVDFPAVSGVSCRPCSVSVSVTLRGVFPPADSVRLLLPVPADLPWQSPSGNGVVSVTGIDGSYETGEGWMLVHGCSEGGFSVSFVQDVVIDPPQFPGLGSPGVAESLLPFPGEDEFLDRCMDTGAFWEGGSAVYMKAAVLASGEPNPMRLIGRLISEISPLYRLSQPVTGRALLEPAAEMTLEGELDNSFGAASLGAAILRRWQIPALPVPGRASGGVPFVALASYVKPFGWMIVSPCPDGFTAMGAFDPPAVKSWFNGVAGITFHAEYLGSDGLWRAVPVDSRDFVLDVEISLL